PPAIARWLTGLVAPENEAEPIQGDLLEEFSEVASSKSAGAARCWYWKQSLKTSAHLFWTGLRTAPWRIASTALVGFFILWYAQNQLQLPTRLVCAVIDRYSSFYMNHFSSWQFCLNYGIPAVTWILVVALGCLIAVVAKGREIVATAMFSLFQFVGTPLLTLFFVIVYDMRFGQYLTHVPADSAYIRVTIPESYHYGGIGALALLFISPLTTLLLPLVAGITVRNLRQSSVLCRGAA
ncbi:MAG: hypothetical protein ACRD5K_09920, partial [Candidatus Acidiferrales bacterium]